MTARVNKRLLFWILFPLIIAGGGYFYFSYSQNNASSDNSVPAVMVEEGTIVEKALAIGTIEPETEIEVKSIIPGVVDVLFVDEGQFVRKGDPLIEVRPDPTPLELAEAKRNLERIFIERQNLEKELTRVEEMKKRNLISDREYEQALERVEDVRVREQISRERLELLESGKITIGDTKIESIIRAPIDGYILERMVEKGDPIVPLTSYQAGTPLMSLAQMDKLLFKGMVDEIDVGKIEIGLPVEIKIGALPGSIIPGEVSKISLKARQQDNATVFPVEIMITETENVTLRAGFSANADIIINRRIDVPTIPERLVHFNEGVATVELSGSEPGQRDKHEIELGLSDAINVEVVSGLSIGDKVLEPESRSLTLR